MHENRKHQHEKINELKIKDEKERLSQPHGSYLKKGLYHDFRTHETKLLGDKRRLDVAINNRDYIDPTHVWTFKKGIAYHPTDDEGDYEENRLEERMSDVYTDHNGQRHTLENKVPEYYVGNTNLNPKYLRQIAKFAKDKGLLQVGSLQELQMKAIFESSPKSIKPVAIHIGKNTFFIAPKVAQDIMNPKQQRALWAKTLEQPNFIIEIPN